MSLGLFVFSLPTLAHDELQRRADYRHPTSPRIGARDATQFTGVGTETISLSGSAYAELCQGAASLDDLRDMAARGEYWPLLNGAGQVFGDFVITGIDERHKVLFEDGTPRRIDFGIDLLRVDGNRG